MVCFGGCVLGRREGRDRKPVVEWSTFFFLYILLEYFYFVLIRASTPLHVII